MSNKTVTPFVRVPSPDLRPEMQENRQGRRHTSFETSTPRGDGTPPHVGVPISIQTPIYEKDEYAHHASQAQTRAKGIDDVAMMSEDDQSLRSRALESMKSFFWRRAKEEDKILTWLNYFRNTRTEESYQLEVSQQSIGQSQLVLLFLIVSRVIVAAWWYYARGNDALVGLEVLAERYADPFHWLFVPFGVCVAFMPFRFFNSWGKTKLFAYWIRRYWKYCVMLILILFCVGYHIYYSKMFQDSKEAFKAKLDTTTCGLTIPPPHEFVDGVNSTFFLMQEFTWGLQEYMYNMFVINTVATAIVLCLSLKLDFPQAWVVLGCSFVFYLVDWAVHPPSNKLYRSANYFVFGFAIFLPIISGLTAFYFIDRDSRMAFFTKVDAERVNTALKHGVTVNRLKYQTRGRVGPFEEQLLQELLAKTPENALIHNVSIPFDDLTLHELITEHTKGDVVRGEYTGLRVAIKRLSVLTRETIIEYKMHVELLACLRHPNVVQFIGASFDSLTNLCVVTEFMEKGNVYSLLRTPMTLEWNDPLLQIAIDAAQGIAYLHHSNVIHRDLKSENLLCTATYACKVSDFGESRQVQTQEYLETMVGTPYWLAPEILREKPYQNKVDCYSFGIVLIELESRRDPYFDCDDMSTIDIMMQVASGTLRPTIPSSCPPRRRALIELCLSDDPHDRPSMVTILKTLQTEIRDEVLASRFNVSDPHQNRRQLLQKHQMLNRRGLHEVLANDHDLS